MTIATTGTIRKIARKGMMPAYRARLRTGLGALRNERKRRTPGSVSYPGVVTTSVMSAMSAGDRRPLLGDDTTCRGLLCRGRQLQGRAAAWHGRQRVVRGLVDRARGDHGAQRDRAGRAREEEVLAFGRVQVLLPQPGGGGVGRGLADRLVVVPGVHAVRRD